MPDPIKIKRTLYIGLGGTGVKAILKAKQCFVDAYGEVPPMVAFLAIDTDTAIRESYEISRTGQHIKLSDNEIAFCGINGSALNIVHQHPSSYTWIPNGNDRFLSGLSNNGAGAVRSNGRFLVRYNANGIGTKISQKVTEISSPLPEGSRFVYNTAQNGAAFPTFICIVGSVAGGTGSGSIIDTIILTAQNIRNTGKPFVIHPWIVLPDVFRHNYPGAMSSNVYQNAYAALRELDYLYHLPTGNTNPLDFGFAKIKHMPEEVGDTYLINMSNKADIRYQTVKDLADSIGRCLFLEGNEFSSSVGSVLDNTQHVRFHFDIKDKQAHYVSAGSAELVYDNQAVGNAIAAAMIADICTELCKSDDVGTLQDVMKWTMHQDVRIQEHDTNQLTDDLLSLDPGFSLEIGKGTDSQYIKEFIKSCCDTQEIHDSIKNSAANKLVNVKSQLTTELKSIVASKGFGSAIAFLNALNDNLIICDSEMQEELQALNQRLSVPRNWDTELSNLPRNLWGKINEDAAQALADSIKSDYIASKRDALRHQWAISFYANLMQDIQARINKLTATQQHLINIKANQLGKIAAIQNLATTTSNFQIYLHADDVVNIPRKNGSAILTLLSNQVDLFGLVGCSQDVIQEKLWNFAKQQPDAVRAVNVSIDEKLASMPKTKVKAYLDRIKKMSSPLWNTNTQGYSETAQPLNSIFVIGTCNASRGTIQDSYASEFEEGIHKPVFASTHQTDRITFFQTELYSPVYAIVNVLGYKAESEQRDVERTRNKNTYPAGYIDEKWYQRMETEKFDVLPKAEQDMVLPSWIIAIVYGYIKFDDTANEYYTKSRQGNRLRGGYLALGKRRDIAFENFRTRGLDVEVRERYENEIIEKGRPAVEAVMRQVKNDDINYVPVYAQLSPVELDRVQAEDPAYEMVIRQLERELEYITSLEI